MSVSKQDREAYEKGVKESKEGFLTNIGSPLRDMLFHSSSESAAYRKGLIGERLDEDKKDESSSNESRSSASAKPESSDEDEGESNPSRSHEDSGSYSYPPSSSDPSLFSSTDLSGMWIILVIVAILIGIGSLGNISKMLNSPTPGGSYVSSTRSYYTAPISVAPEQIVDRGACPFEGCRYGERWLAKQDVDVYEAPPTTVGIATDSLQKKTVICPGEWVTTETGVVLARRHEGRVVERTNYGAVVVNGPPLRIGQAVSLYSYLGEDCWTAWINGRFLVVCGPESQPEKTRNEWWIRIKMSDGSQGWINSSQSLISQEGLNSELGKKIEDVELALPDKLVQIDALIEGGADLNGSGGQYGTTPVEAAIRTKDPELLRELISKGLKLRNGDAPASNLDPSGGFLAHGINIQSGLACPAFAATQVALKPGGDLLLEFLLENGIQLSCLSEPPMLAFLRFGIATDNYSADQAIKAAEVLIRHGVSVDQLDSQGKSIFDLLNQENVASRPHADTLREALAKLAKDQVSP